MIVRMLLGVSAVEMAIAAIRSLSRHSDRPLRFVVHDDGTLTVEQIDRLRAALPDVDVVERAAADAAVEATLSRYPAALRYRRRSALALKLLDLPLYAGGGDLAYCDTDILAFGPFAGLFEWPDSTTRVVFMPDSQNAYALRPWHLVGSRGVAVPASVNTGVLLARTDQHDLDFIEWILERQFRVYDRIPGWLEQTCWAAIGQRAGCRLYDPDQVRVIRSRHCLADSGLLIGHFTSRVRGLWPAALTRPSATHHHVRVRTRDSRPLTAFGLAADHVRRAVANRVGIVR